MKEEISGFKYRLSHVLAWLGFGLLVMMIAFGLWYGDILMVIVGLIFQVIIGILNYLIAGRMRLLPWVKISR